MLTTSCGKGLIIISGNGKVGNLSNSSVNFKPKSKYSSFSKVLKFCHSAKTCAIVFNGNFFLYISIPCTSFEKITVLNVAKLKTYLFKFCTMLLFLIIKEI